ncbi:MAG TPA: NHL repeat-containing protein [Rickettsiales bacterium]|nr:NHL repeat-containing protein [Rickettsiales bacterium]
MMDYKHSSGFTLLQISILLTVASLVVVATLPSTRSALRSNEMGTQKMEAILSAVRQYEASHGYVPCPADPNLAVGNTAYGMASANSGASSNCSGGSIYAVTSSPNHVAIGMVPVRTLGLASSYALDSYGRDITYTVDTGATACWTSTTQQGSITVNDNGHSRNAVLALISHGADGYGAWLPLPGTGSGTTRLNSGSTDTSQADNAQVAHGGGLTNNTAFASFVIKPATSTFDDLVVYKTQQWDLRQIPMMETASITPPSNNTYSTGAVLTFTLAFSSPVTVTGTPRLVLSALGTGSIGTSNTAYANYVSGSGSNALIFTYTVPSADWAPSGISLSSSISLNGGSITRNGVSQCIYFSPPDLSQVVIDDFLWVADCGNNRILKLSSSGAYVSTFATGLNQPNAVAVDGNGNVWVGDSGNNRLIKYDYNGNVLLTTGSTGTGNGQFTVGTNVQQLAIDSSNNVWATDYGNNRVEEFNGSTGAYMNKISLTNSPSGVAIDNSGNIWIISPNDTQIKRCTSVSSCAFVSGISFSNVSGLDYSDYITVDRSGVIWASDEGNCKVYKFNSSGSYSGTLPGSVFSCTGGRGVDGLGFDRSNTLWGADEYSTSSYIYNITPATGALIKTIGTAAAGSGTSPLQFYYPQNIFFGR